MIHSKMNLRSIGKAMTYVGVALQLAVVLKKPFEGSEYWIAQGVCVLLWISGILVFKNNLEPKS